MASQGPPAAGTVRAIYIGPTPREPMQSVGEVEAVSGKGLDGDRYADGEGTFSKREGTGREITLIESEAVEAVRRDCDIDLTEDETRRNVVTAGVALNHLVGKEFAVGDVVLRGARLNEPCAHLEGLTYPGLRQALLHRGGLRADIVRGGTLREGDPVDVRD